MNCFEARNDFVAFWQKTLVGERRAQLLLHLRGCTACDRSFRSFALTAPVLYSASEPEWEAQAAPPTINARRLDRSSTQPLIESRLAVRTINRVVPAFLMAAAA